MTTTCQMAVLENRSVAKDIYLLSLQGTEEIEAHPGQFASLSVPGFFLRRPLGIVSSEKGKVTFLYKALGEGTKRLSEMKPGESLDVLLPLGHGFPLPQKECLLVGAGLGIAPLLALARTLKEKGIPFGIRFAFNAKEDIPLLDEILKQDAGARIATLDGSYGTKGIFTDILQEGDSRKAAYCCGPMGFLKACEKTFQEGYLSLECRMGCGYGICNGCTVVDKGGKRRKICKDGPVFALKEVTF